ncbi:MAG: glycosyltransferase family 9 protein [Pyrinomonadaceae bacterium]
MKEQFETELPGAAHWDWSKVKRVLVVRLRSIGDTVLATPSLIALRRLLPDAQIDILLEDWVAPLLEGLDVVDNVLTVKRGDTLDRLRVMLKLAGRGYDVAYNLHGGTTAGFFTAATLATHRVGFNSYQNKFLYNYLAPPASEFWRQEKNHSAEQQLALLGWTGVPVEDRPKSRLVVKPELLDYAAHFFREYEIDENYPFALIHPAAAFETKQWATENFAAVVKFLYEQGIISIAVGTRNDLPVLLSLFNQSPLALMLYDKTLPQITALASRAKIFVGNDSGIAHIAAAVNTPSVVIFGSSNIAHWRPWTNAPNEVVSENLLCAPCAGFSCSEFDQPQCIRRVSVQRVIDAIKRVLFAAQSKSEKA